MLKHNTGKKNERNLFDNDDDGDGDLVMNDKEREREGGRDRCKNNGNKTNQALFWNEAKEV